MGYLERDILKDLMGYNGLYVSLLLDISLYNGIFNGIFNQLGCISWAISY